MTYLTAQGHAPSPVAIIHDTFRFAAGRQEQRCSTSASRPVTTRADQDQPASESELAAVLQIPGHPECFRQLVRDADKGP